MRLTGKFAAVAVFVVALSGSIFAADDKTFAVVQKGSTDVKVDFSGLEISLADKNARDKLLKAFREGTDGEHTLTAGAQGLAPSNTITYADGSKVVITAAASADSKQKITLTHSAAPSAFQTNTVAVADVTVSATGIVVKKPTLQNFYALTTENDSEILNLINRDGVGLYSKKTATIKKYTNANQVKADGTEEAATPTHSVAVAEEFKGCYDVTGKYRICVSKGATTDVTVSVCPIIASKNNNSWLEVVQGYAPIGGVVLAALFLPIPMSYIHGAIDPAGYQAGKDLSFLPAGYKGLMYETEYASEEIYDTLDDDNLDGPVTVDPNTGRPIRGGKKTQVGGQQTDQESEQPTASTTDAYGASIMAAALLVPFLL